MNSKLRMVSCLDLSVLIVASTCAAAGVISYWNSDAGSIGYQPTQVRYYSNKINSSFTEYNLAVSHAYTQWTNALPMISMTSASQANANTFFYGGTYSQLLTYFPDLTSDAAGQTAYRREYETNVRYQSSTMDVYSMYTNSKCCLVLRNGGIEAEYLKTMAHEVGHSLGWFGHSSNSSDVMYYYTTSNKFLTTRDKQHLRQIYDLFY